MYDESPDGDLIQSDMTQILLNQEKYRRLLGDMNVQNILAQMHPTQSTAMDNSLIIEELPYQSDENESPIHQLQLQKP